MDNKTVCAAFWQNTVIRPNNQIFACPRYKTSIGTFHKDTKLQDILQLSEYDKLRKDSLDGVYNSNCAKCYYEEELGTESMRQVINKEYNTDSVELIRIEIGFDNICNLTCDGCRGEFSSSWAKLENPLVPVKENIKQITANFAELPTTIKKISFKGGEPMMTSKHTDLLTKVKNKSEVEVMYHTNGTFLLDQSTIDVFKEFKHIEIIVSLDGYGELNDRVRSGSRWEDILMFIDQIKSLGFGLMVHSVIHKNSYLGLKDLSDFIQTRELRWRVHILTYPEHLDIIHLTDVEKTEFIKLLEDVTIPVQDQLFNKKAIINHVDRKSS